MKRVATLPIGLLGIGFLVCLFVPGPALAGSGLYLSSELGANFAPSLDTTGADNDRPSTCDAFINPQYASIAECVAPSQGDAWRNAFDSAEGILAGAAVGYRLRARYPDHLLGRFRLEVEYFYRDSAYDQTAPTKNAQGEGIATKLKQEVQQADYRLGSLTSHNLFGNLYFDFWNTSRFTPYVGFGVGVGFTGLDWSGVWARNTDPNKITTGEGLPNADEIRRNLAGTTTVENATLNDVLFGYQVLFGLDYALTEALTLGVKGRWINFDSFRDGNQEWDRLRSHASQTRLDGEPVRYRQHTGDTEMFGVSLNLKYHF